MRARPGFTLIELIVVIAIAGMLATISGLTLSKRVSDAHRLDRRALLIRELSSARKAALEAGRVIVVQIEDSADSGAARRATALPDGSVIVDSAVAAFLKWDRLEGMARPPTSGGLH